MYGTLANPLQVTPGSIATQEQDAQRRAALADALMGQQMQAGPSKGLNILMPFLQVAAANFQNKRADTAASEALNKRLTWEGEQKRAALTEERDWEKKLQSEVRAQREKDADAWGLKGRQKAIYIAEGKIIEDAKPDKPTIASLAERAAQGDKAAEATLARMQRFEADKAAAGRAPERGPDPLAIQRELEWYKSLSPEERAQVDHIKGRDKGGMTVYDPATGNPIYQTGGGAELTTPVRTNLQEGITGAETSLSNLKAVGDKFADEYLTYGGRAKAALGGVLDKAGVGGDLSGFNAKRTQFRNEVNQLWNTYRKEITGAGAGVKELEMLKDSMMNDEQGPQEFQAAYSQFMEKAQRELELKKQQLGGGAPAAPKGAPKRMRFTADGELIE